MEERAELTSYNFPPCVRKLEVLINLLSILVTMGMQSCTIGLFMLKGNPK
jgi:hypothetical protein